MKHEYQKHLPTEQLSTPAKNAKREYMYAKRYDAPKDVLDRLHRTWQALDNDK